MAINWTDADIEKVVCAVLKNLKCESASETDWNASSYRGRDFIGVYTDMESAIDAATSGYKAVRAMSLEERERVIEVIENGEERIVRIHLLDSEPIKWRPYSPNWQDNVELTPIDFNFGFIATPLRELPANMFPEHSFHVDCFKKIAENYEDFFSNPVVEGSEEIGFDRLKRLGVNVLYLHEKWNDIQNMNIIPTTPAAE